MRAFAILGRKAALSLGPLASKQIFIEGVPVYCGLMEITQPTLEKSGTMADRQVLVRVRAFSLNYRDKYRVLAMAAKGPEDGFYVVGSEFCGEIVEVGSAVSTVSPGDRVIGNNAYPLSGHEGLAAGVPTNHSSSEYLVLHEAKVQSVPQSMSDATGAAFSIGGQTTYSMIRKLNLRPGASVMVTAAKSNTSIWAINALRNRGVKIYGLSSSNRFEQELIQMGLTELAVVGENDESFASHRALAPVIANGGFDGIIDPYWDLYLSRSLETLAFGGAYITCGLYNQYNHLTGKMATQAPRTGRELGVAIIKNLRIEGNCIGLTEDLQNAIEDYQQGRLRVVIDSCYTGAQTSEFLSRTFNDPNRFGKVIYQYE